MELVENRESVGRIQAALAGGMPPTAVAADCGISVQALRELLARHVPVDLGAPTG